MTMVAAGIYPWLRRLALVRGAIAGVVASFSGLLVSMVVGLARPRGPDSLRWSWVRRESSVEMEHSHDLGDWSGALGNLFASGRRSDMNYPSPCWPLQRTTTSFSQNNILANFALARSAGTKGGGMSDHRSDVVSLRNGVRIDRQLDFAPQSERTRPSRRYYGAQIHPVEGCLQLRSLQRF